MATYRGVWTREDRATSIYQYVPFDVPPGAAGVSVRLSFDRTRGVLDLGVFSPQGFRGYSGGARDRFTITVAEATPGYLPGPLPAGEWQVLLGLHRIPADGLAWTVEVEVGAMVIGPTPAPPPLPERPPGRDLPAPAGHRWLAGDLHAHTVHSDGLATISQLAALARGRGLDFLAVTDHNTTSHHPHLPRISEWGGVVLVPGQEVTTDTGHANCFGDVGWVDFRQSADHWLATAEAREGLLSLNHPVAGELAWRQPLPRAAHLVEAWHATWDRRSDKPLEWWQRAGGVGVGGSDVHDPRVWTLGTPTTWAQVGEGSGTQGVLDALAAGRVAISAEPDGPVVVRHEDQLIVDRGAGLALVEQDGRRTPVTGDRFSAPAGPGVHRLVDADGMVAALTA